jgi:ATP-dependent helicase/nuclease subunit A
MSSSYRLPFDEGESAPAPAVDPDRAARERSVDPRYNVALEASAGTGKTRVLVDRYVNLLRAGVDPANILAITFTRKAAAEMRERILATLRSAAERGEIPPARWRELRDRTGDINISTIDAFCLSLLREFPLEADLDPGFSMADDMEVPRLIEESLDRALRICRSVARDDEAVALVFAQLNERRARAGLAALLNRRIVAPAVLDRFLARGSSDLTVGSVAAAGAAALIDVFRGMPGGLDRFLETGPPDAAFVLLAGRLQELGRSVDAGVPVDPAAVHAAFAAAREYFLTQEGKPRTSRLTVPKARFASVRIWEVHRELVVGHASELLRSWLAFRRDLNVLVSRGVRRMFAIAESEYRRTLDAHAVLDFHDVLLKALALLRQMEEFAQSRYRLEARYHHVLVDEFQDTSRAQWELVELLIASWGAGAGLAHSGPLQPSVFIVGDRKQSIYAFRDADVSVLREAGRHLELLRPDGNVRRTISRSFRSVPALLAFVNDICAMLDTAPSRSDAFRYEEGDRFPLDGAADGALSEDVLGIVPGDTPEECAELVADEIASLIGGEATIRDRETGLRRAARPGDISILFRTRETHREFEQALERRGVPAYVYKGLGFFDADEIKDVLALLRYLADPTSDLRAAAILRSGFGGVSDEGLRRLAPGLAGVLQQERPEAAMVLDDDDRVAMDVSRRSLQRWCGLVDRMPPSELLDLILEESAYAVRLRGVRLAYARENLKKIRAIIRRIQNRGYATMGRIADHLDRLAVGDEPNAVIDALDAVSLMTVHAAKGLEFPVVFVVNAARGTGNRRDAIRIAGDPSGDAISVAVGDYRSEADEDDAAREREETKRLLYVALTRARDRLYLSTALKDGRVQPGRGSLADVWPSSLLDVFSAGYGDADQVNWNGPGGSVHRFRVVKPNPDAIAHRRSRSPMAAAESDFEPVADSTTVRTSVAAVVAAEPPIIEYGSAPSLSRRSGDAAKAGDVLIGLLVHRLLQRFGVTIDVDDTVLAEAVSGFLRREHSDAASDPGIVDDVVARFRALRDQPEVKVHYATGAVFHEVPFSFAADGQIIRGAIDCLIRHDDGSIRILEFKTGQRRDEHVRQAGIYRRAAEAIFADTVVRVDVVYALNAVKS